MQSKSTRRRFLKTTAATGIGFWVAGGVQAQESKSPNEKIQMASVGIGGKGGSDSKDAGKSGQMIAVCDVDEKKFVGVENRFPGAKTYTDFRKMLEENEDKIDAVTVSTPDHCHAPASLMAMRMKKACFCQKPLTRTIYEARLMGETARKMGVATEMGNQGTARSGLRKAAALIRAGALGAPKEVHVWTNRPIWPQGVERGKPKECPPHLNWDLWLGPAPERPYADGYHTFNWRGWWDFGSGALGDMACHTVNMPFAGLELRNPISVQAVTSGHNKDSFPGWSIITFEFPANDWRPAMKLFWYDGKKKPSPDVIGGKPLRGSGCAIIGEKATIYSPDDYGANFEVIGDVTLPEVEIENSPGHFAEWIRAIQGGPPAMSNFPDYAGPLTETILLGNLAVWVAAGDGNQTEVQGEKVEWDAKNLKVKNIAGLESIVKPNYRKGYTLDV